MSGAEAASAPGGHGGSESRRESLWAWIVVALVLIAVALIRVRLLDLPLDRDEGEYAYFGQLLLQGVPPYASAYNFKLPGIYVAYAAILAVFGQTPGAIHVGLLIANAIYVEVSAGNNYTCGITNKSVSGNLYCTGLNNTGQLGNGYSGTFY